MIQAPAHSPAAAVEGLYVYCVVQGGDHRLFGPIGLDGQVVHTLGRGELRAVVHNCPAQPYQSRDPQAVEAWVLAHQNVVRAAGTAFGAVLPMAFDMIVRPGPGGGADETLEAWLNEKHEHLARLLAKVAGKAEFGVQVLWDRPVVAAKLLHDDPQLHALQDRAHVQPKG